MTFLSSQRKHEITTNSLGHLKTGGSANSSLTATSTPQEILDKQLDFVEQSEGSLINGSVKCATFNICLCCNVNAILLTVASFSLDASQAQCLVVHCICRTQTLRLTHEKGY